MAETQIPKQRDPIAVFDDEVKSNIQRLSEDASLQQASLEWLRMSLPHKYSYNFTCLGRPVIQYPQDIVAVQELIWSVRPDIVIETGVAHGGSLALSASMLALLDYCDASSTGSTLNPRASQRRVLGIDIEIRPHNRDAIQRHPLSHMIELLEAPSTDALAISRAVQLASGKRTMVLLDSNHTHSHVLAELRAYAPLTSVGSYCVVFDTVVDRLPRTLYPNRDWGPGNSPMTAVNAYLAELNQVIGTENPAFEVDKMLDAKLMISVAPRGFLRRVA